MRAVTARILDGRAVAAQIRSEVSERVRALSEKGVTPGLAAVLVGDDQASRIYVGAKHKACADVGIRSEQVDLPSYVTEGELLATLRRLNRDPEIHGIIVQLPMPPHLRELEVQRTIAPEKDVDGLHPWNIGMMMRGEPTFLPATPYGIVELLLRSEIPLEGAGGRGGGLRRPRGRAAVDHAGAGLDPRERHRHVHAHQDARPAGAHAERRHPRGRRGRAAGLIGGDMIKPGATVIDVGVHRTADGLVGDVKYDEAAEVAGAITPVPGGVGPMTVAMLLVNTVAAAEAAAFGR